jgi:glycosyltransferase involved in cell wall biosynthesis
MNVTVINSAEHGGAASAAKSLQKGLAEIGVSAEFIGEQKVIAQKKGLFAKLCNWWSVRKYIKKNAGYLRNAPPGFDHFSFARTGYQNIHRQSVVKNADVLSLHWLSYLIDYPTFFKRINKPLVWTLHDTNLFTGGCHYTFGCQKYETDCANCPQLPAGVRAYAAKDNLKIKIDSLKHINPANIAIISPSVWLKNLSEKSTLFKGYQHFHIPNGIDTNIYKQLDRAQSRVKLGLPADKFIILFVGTLLSEHRKGFDIILRLNDELKLRDDIQFVAIGKTNESYTDILNLGYITDASFMAMAYSAASVFVIPSRQDNLPNTMLEALCCGTPVIGYKTGGIVDAIQHGENGFLVDQENVTDIVRYIMDMNNKTIAFNNDKISEDAKQKYSLEKQALAYKEIIDQVFSVS